MGRHVYFADNLESPSYEEHLDGLTIHVPEINGVGRYEVPAETIVGELNPAFNIYSWKGPAHPTIIYHHGTMEEPFDFSAHAKNTFFHIFGNDRKNIDANLIVIRAPFHTGTPKEFARKMRRLSNLVAMLTVSVKLIEHLAAFSKHDRDIPVLVAGISLGGFVANLHRAFYNTADIYVPMLAGAALESLFLDSRYRTMTGKNALANPDALAAALNFEDRFERVADNNVFPLLARYDRLILYERQARCYGDLPVRVLDRGHVTAALSTDILRDHIVNRLKK